MSLKDAIQNYIEENSEITKPEFMKMVGELFTSIMNGKKGKEGETKIKTDVRGGFKGAMKVKPKKILNAYQVFMKEQMPILQKRESKKGDGEQKKKPRELMTEISELWKKKKETVV